LALPEPELPLPPEPPPPPAPPPPPPPPPWASIIAPGWAAWIVVELSDRVVREGAASARVQNAIPAMRVVAISTARMDRLLVVPGGFARLTANLRNRLPQPPDAGGQHMVRVLSAFRQVGLGRVRPVWCTRDDPSCWLWRRCIGARRGRLRPVVAAVAAVVVVVAAVAVAVALVVVAVV
jgi:hypothetical protein